MYPALCLLHPSTSNGLVIQARGEPESTTKPLSVGGEKLHAKVSPDLKIMIQVNW
jgi:hypothetical protein